MAIENRYEFMFYIECRNGNPNGDPDMGNTPRTDPQSLHGYITDVAIKRRIRNYVQAAYQGNDGMEMLVRSASNINTGIARAKALSGTELSAKGKNEVYAGRRKACEMFYDVRTFGAVMSTGSGARACADSVCTFSGSHSAIGYFHHENGHGGCSGKCKDRGGI